MYNLPYAYAYALPDMRCITLVLMHILIQSSYKSTFSYKTSGDAETSDDAETHMQHTVLRMCVDGDNGLSPEIIDRHYVTASLLRGLPFLV